MPIRTWSTTPGSNNDSPPFGFPEGQAPSSLNNGARQVMADVRSAFESLPFFDFGHDPTRIDDDTFTVATDLTATYAAGRRVKLVGATTGYATIASSSYSAPDTTVNVTMDSGTVPASLLTVALGHDSNSTSTPRFDRTAAEIAAVVTPDDYAFPGETSGIVTLSRYLGWDPSGATSSHTAFTNAMELILEQGANHTEAAQIGGRIIVPYGIALLSQTVPVEFDNITIIGGHGATIRTNGAFPAFSVEAPSLQKIYGTLIQDLRFTSTITNRAAGSGAIEVIDAEMIRIIRCKFHLMTQYGVRWENVINGYLNDCDFDSGDWENPGMAYGLLAEANATSGCNASHVTRSTFRRTTVAGVALLGAELHSPGASAVRRECAGNSVTHCDLEHNYGDGVQLLRNRALIVGNNWFESNGSDGVSGHGHIMDLATDDNEAFADPSTSGLGAANRITSNVFGQSSAAHASFQHIGLKFQSAPIIESNYFTSGNIGLTADCRDLVIENNWSGGTVLTLVGALPTRRYVRNNRLGPTDTYTVTRPWGGSFYDYDYDWKPDIAADADTTPSLISATFGRIRTLLVANTGATSITYLDDGYEGMIVRVIATNGNTTLVNGGNNALNLAGNVNFVMAATDSITLMLIDTGGFTLRWIELCRSVN